MPHEKQWFLKLKVQCKLTKVIQVFYMLDIFIHHMTYFDNTLLIFQNFEKTICVKNFIQVFCTLIVFSKFRSTGKSVGRIYGNCLSIFIKNNDVEKYSII